MLVRTSSGNTSVGHLSHSPHGFSALHRPDVSFQCGGLVFPVHSMLLSVSSRFFTDFFSFLKGQARPEIISLDAVKCTALSAISLSYYLDFIYSGALPQCDEVDEMVELLRLASFLGHAPLQRMLCASLAGKLTALGEAELLEVFRAASDLKLRTLVTDCLVLLLPQLGTAQPTQQWLPPSTSWMPSSPRRCSHSWRCRASLPWCCPLMAPAPRSPAPARMVPAQQTVPATATPPCPPLSAPAPAPRCSAPAAGMPAVPPLRMACRRCSGSSSSLWLCWRPRGGASRQPACLPLAGQPASQPASGSWRGAAGSSGETL